MTLEHIAALYFEGKSEATKKRMQKLKAAGLLAERPRRASEPSVLHLSSDALALLRERGLLADYPALTRTAMVKRTQVSGLTLLHELEILSIKSAMVPAVNALARFGVSEFSTWPLLNEFKVSRRVIDPNKSGEITIKPDGFIRIQESEPDGSLSEHTFYLEHDRSTESQQVLATKARAYLEHYRSGGLAAKHGRPRSEFREFPFRVLMVLQTAERRDNTIAVLLANKPPTLTQVWLTTFEDVKSNPLGAIWIRPKDRRDGGVNDPDCAQRLLGEN